MLCPFRIRKIEYESQIGCGQKGDITAKFTEEQWMECNGNCAYAVVEKTNNSLYEPKPIKCRRAK